MTHVNPALFLNRLVILTHTGSVAFDEKFHRGVNIIRGQNSSGKSTIANFIYYILGGDYNNWTNEALKCREVIAEVELNGATITLKRYITTYGLQPMSIYWDGYEVAMNDSLNWRTYPYKQTTNSVSFTNVLFNTLTFPEVKSDADSNITMHQILRLLYIDQETPTQNLFRFERFDLPLTRQAISELLLGIYDDNLYNSRLRYRNDIKEHDDKKRQYDAINRVYGQSGNATNLSSINRQIESTQKQLSETDYVINKLRRSTKVQVSVRTPLASEKIQRELVPVKNAIAETQDKVNKYELEISDSKQFIGTLEKRVFELNHSVLTRRVLGELPLTHCPQCLSPLDLHSDEGNCILCKRPITEDSEKANAKRLIQEMELQIKESKTLLIQKIDTLTELKAKLPSYIEKARNLQKELNNNIEANQSTRDERIDSLLIEKGGIVKQLEFLAKQLHSVELLERLKEEIAELSKQIEVLKLGIQQGEEQQKTKMQLALNKIRDYTLVILRSDLVRQEEFGSGTMVEVNFQKDTYALDGSNNFSASSKTYFKNAVLFAIFFASLDLDFFRYPKFILCDNMEDKGMEKERTQNLQNVITKLSAGFKKEHQIIFTTSMVADNLNDTAYCVGPQYSQTAKTLKV